MKTLIEDINRKTDNRFVYAIGIFCLLSICSTQFPEARQRSNIEKNEIIVASNYSNNYSTTELTNQN